MTAPLAAILPPVLAAAAAFAVVAAVTPLVIRLARLRGWVAHPAADRWHETPTALMGGIAIFAGVAVPALIFLRQPTLWPVLAAAVLMFIAGFVDDRLGLRPALKLAAQLVAAGLLVYGGWRFEIFNNPVLSVGLTVFWILGITNAVNLVDNMDGLSSGISAIAAVSLAVMALIAGAAAPAAAAAAVAGAAAGFLLYNFKPARIFMGDCGSLFLGFSLAALAVIIQAELGMRGLTAVVMTALVLGVPIIDTTLVTVMRTLNNRPVSQGGRDHTSHRLVRAGLSEKQAVLMLYGLSAFFAVLAPVFYASDIRLRVSLTIFTLIGAVVVAGQIASTDVYGAVTRDENGAVPRRSAASVLLNLPRELLGPAWKPALAMVADLLIVTGAFILAHYLRFEAGLTPVQETFLVQSLPVVLVVSIPVFALFGFYRAIWRHAGALDMARVVAAVTMSSVLGYLALGLMRGFGSISQGVLMIAWMAVILGILFSRFGFRGLRSYLSAMSTSGRCVAVYGADEGGAETIRLLRSNGHTLRPVAIVDNRLGLKGLLLQGVPVVGGLDALQTLQNKGEVTELILPEYLSHEERAGIEAACTAAGITWRTVMVSLESHTAER